MATWGLMRAARSRHIGTGGSQKVQSRAPLQLEGGGNFPGTRKRAAGAAPRCARHLGRARLRSAGWSESKSAGGRSCMVAATRTGRRRLSRRPLSRGSAPSGLPPKSRDRRMPVQVGHGTCLKLQPHASLTH